MERCYENFDILNIISDIFNEELDILLSYTISGIIYLISDYS